MFKNLLLTLVLIISVNLTIVSQDFYTYNAKVVKVYDGDTIWCDIDLGFNVVLKYIKIRLYGVNTPEFKTTNILEKKAGTLVRDDIRYKILNKEVILKTYKKDNSKFGEYLGIIQIDTLVINDYLLKNFYAHEYYGKRKVQFTKTELNDIIIQLQ